MANPETSSPTLSPRMMYSYDRGTNKTWNMPEYKTPRLYQDARLQVQKRKWQKQQKGQKQDRYVTKRGFYMDYHIKVSKGIPASSFHGKQEPWDFKKEKEKSRNHPMDSKLKKFTYLERIEMEQKNRKKPGVGTYSLEQSLKQKQQAIEKLKRRVLKHGEKRYFYEDTEHLSDVVPGAGKYNPHDSVEKLKQTRNDYKYWVDKHKKQNSMIMKRELIRPTAGTYSPLHQSYKTFDTTFHSSKKSLEKRNWFGSDSKFEYTRPVKKKIKEVRPSPASYNTGIAWKGKTQKQQTRKVRDWSEALWKGYSPNKSIYN